MEVKIQAKLPLNQAKEPKIRPSNPATLKPNNISNLQTTSLNLNSISLPKKPNAQELSDKGAMLARATGGFLGYVHKSIGLISKLAQAAKGMGFAGIGIGSLATFASEPSAKGAVKALTVAGVGLVFMLKVAPYVPVIAGSFGVPALIPALVIGAAIGFIGTRLWNGASKLIENRLSSSNKNSKT